MGQDTFRGTQVVRHEARTVTNVELKDISRRVVKRCKEKRPAKGTKKDNVNRVSGRTVSPIERNDYAFVVRQKYGSEGEVSLKVRGVRVEGVLIDSGASCDLIDYKTCSYLKQNHVVCSITLNPRVSSSFAELRALLCG